MVRISKHTSFTRDSVEAAVTPLSGEPLSQNQRSHTLSYFKFLLPCYTISTFTLLFCLCAKARCSRWTGAAHFSPVTALRLNLGGFTGRTAAQTGLKSAFLMREELRGIPEWLTRGGPRGLRLPQTSVFARLFRRLCFQRYMF